MQILNEAVKVFISSKHAFLYSCFNETKNFQTEYFLANV